MFSLLSDLTLSLEELNTYSDRLTSRNWDDPAAASSLVSLFKLG
jgi:hypothetical protein